MTYAEFVKRATGFDPYPYQTELAESRDLLVLLRVPTGAGKTETAVLGRTERYTGAKRLPTPTSVYVFKHLYPNRSPRQSEE